MLKKSLHTPAHLFLDNTPYFVTSAIYQKRPLLAADTVKQHLLETIKACFREKNWTLNDWVILDNHYHLLGVSDKGDDLSKIFRKIHGITSHVIQAHCLCELPVWWNFWDYCPRDEKDYLVRLNYLLINPVKHGYCEDLHAYPFSSFHQRLAQSGREDLAKQFKDNDGYQKMVLQEDDF
ncbi:MAG: transposase [Methylobacter sp.]|jgi:putative transposase|uniref:REP-associated tyrosine transposase n=1 Tax=Methylobacter sp. TaxID=2051955 RepID=UPI0025D3018C|nr:transposase [Methylobacter sp.]MCK9620076.1 transposase [Methylobacter sp.]